MSRFAVVLVTVASEKDGAEMARTLVEGRLAACINIIPRVRSIYRWENVICDEEEALLWIKTREDLLPALQEEVRRLHPYDVPEFIALTISEGSESYLSWILEVTADASS